MKYIDFIFQSLVIGVVLLGTLFGLVAEGSLTVPLIPAGAFFLGPWQVLSSLLSVASNSRFQREKKYHLLGSAGYFVLMFLLYLVSDAITVPWIISGAILYLPPAILAGYYYWLTWLWIFRPQSNSGFLRHTNF